MLKRRTTHKDMRMTRGNVFLKSAIGAWTLSMDSLKMTVHGGAEKAKRGIDQ
jgi:hypothetical protein